MGYLKACAVLGAVVGLTSASPVPADEVARLTKRGACDGGSWVGPNVVGGDGPDQICETHWGGDYQPITGIEAWSDENRIRGIQFTYAGGATSKLYGQIDQTQTAKIAVDYSKGEKFTNVVMYGTGDGKELGHIYMETGSQKLDIGKSTKGIHPYPANIGGGILLGAIGTSGWDINSLGWLFIAAEIDNIKVDNIKFDESALDSKNDLTPVTLDQTHYFNSQKKGNVTYSFTGGEDRQTSQTYSSTTTLTLGASVALELSGEVLGIGGKATTTFSWQVSEAVEISKTTSDTVKLTYGMTGSLEPGKGVDCTAYAEKGEGSFPYTSTVTVNLKDGSKYTYDEQGKTDKVAFSRTWVSTKDNDDANAPPGLTEGDVKPQGGGDSSDADSGDSSNTDSGDSSNTDSGNSSSKGSDDDDLTPSDKQPSK